jgi:hypothetical protein
MKRPYPTYWRRRHRIGMTLLKKARYLLDLFPATLAGTREDGADCWRTCRLRAAFR